MTPMKPKRPCSHPGCPEFAVKGSKCQVHAKVSQWRTDRDRGTSHQRGYGARWQKARGLYLQEHPLCVQCGRQGIVRAANVVDHIIPHRGDYDLFWDVGNWQSLCTRCHATKTAAGK